MRCVGLGCRWCRGPGRAGAGPSPRAPRSGARPATRWSRGRPAGPHRPTGRCRGPGRRRGRPAPRPTRCPRRTPDACARARAGHRRRPPGGAGPRSGMNRTIASSTSRSTPAGPDPVREPRDLLVHEPRRRRARVRSWRGRSAGPATPAGPRPAPGPRCAGAGAAARGPHPGRPCRSRWAARPRPRTRPPRTPRPAGRRVRRPGPGCRRTAPRRGSTPPGAGPPRRPRRCSRSASAASAAGAAVPGVREHRRQRCPCGVEVGCPRSWLHSSRTGVRFKSGIRRHFG